VLDAPTYHGAGPIHSTSRLFLFFFSSGCIRHRVFSTQTGPVYAGVTTVRFQRGHGRCCAALSRLYTGRRGSSSVSFRLSGAREGRGAIPRYLPVRHVTSFDHKLHTWACLSISTRTTRATTRSRSQALRRGAWSRRVFELSRCLDWPNTRLWWGAQPRRLGRCPQSTPTHPLQESLL
jgi:hypothetical protein